MKIKVLILLAFLSAAFAKAQSLVVVSSQTMENAAGTNVGDKISYASVKNLSGFPISVKVIRTVNNLASASHYSQFCWGNCYASTVSVSPQNITIPGGATDSIDFISYLYCGGVNGTSIVSYEFVNASNASDSASVTFNYIVNNATSGIADLNNNTVAALQTPYPSPADQYAVLKYSIPAGKRGVLNIYNTLGALSFKTNLDEKQSEYAIPTPLLSDGLYFCTLQVDGKPVSSKKLVVNHHN